MGERPDPTNNPPAALDAPGPIVRGSLVRTVQAAFDIYDAVAPFIEAWKALPLAIQADRDRNLADVIGIYTPDDRAALTVGNLTELVQAFVELGLHDAPAHKSPPPQS